MIIGTLLNSKPLIFTLFTLLLFYYFYMFLNLFFRGIIKVVQVVNLLRFFGNMI